jgi:hypothetical protein
MLWLLDHHYNHLGPADGAAHVHAELRAVVLADRLGPDVAEIYLFIYLFIITIIIKIIIIMSTPNFAL